MSNVLNPGISLLPSSLRLFAANCRFYQLTTACCFLICWEFKQNFVQPNRPDEMARIAAAGGRVLFINGYRVRGILAMSRAIGTNVCTFTSFYFMRLLLVIPSAYIYPSSSNKYIWKMHLWAGFSVSWNQVWLHSYVLADIYEPIGPSSTCCFLESCICSGFGCLNLITSTVLIKIRK